MTRRIWASPLSLTTRHPTQSSRAILCALLLPCAMALSAETLVLEYEQGIELDSRTLVASPQLMPGDAPEADVVVGYHADRVDHAVAMHTPGRESALLLNTRCNELSATELENLALSPIASDESLADGHCLAIRSDTGQLFLLEGVSESGQQVSIEVTTIEGGQP